MTLRQTLRAAQAQRCKSPSTASPADVLKGGDFVTMDHEEGQSVEGGQTAKGISKYEKEKKEKKNIP